MNNKPVAWWTGEYDDEGDDFMFPKTRQAHIDHPASETHKFFPIPLYTHPVKELTDEDLELITEALLMVGFTDSFINYDLKEQALAILRKAQEK